MRRFVLLASVLLAASASAVPPEPAAKLMADAQAKAKREGKNVMVVFHASWCGWCKKFDKMLESPELKPVFAKSYVVVHLDVLESKEKQSLENPGGVEMMESLGGKDAGLPFFAVVGPDGKKLGDSLQKEGDARTNTGHPAKPEEIATFMTLLKKTAKKSDANSRAKIEAYLKADAAGR